MPCFQASYTYCYRLVDLAQIIYPGLLVPALTLRKVGTTTGRERKTPDEILSPWTEDPQLQVFRSFLCLEESSLHFM